MVCSVLREREVWMPDKARLFQVTSKLLTYLSYGGREGTQHAHHVGRGLTSEAPPFADSPIADCHARPTIAFLGPLDPYPASM